MIEPQVPAPSERKYLKSFFAIWLVLLVVISCWVLGSGKSLNEMPSELGADGFFYDNMALCLLDGKGFSVDFQEQVWRDRISERLDDQGKGQQDWLLRIKDDGPTAMRSPGYPLVLSGLYRVTGWRWDAARLLSAIMVSIGLALLLSWAYVQWGTAVAATALMTVCLDFSIMQSAFSITTEPLGILTFAITFLCLVRCVRYQTPMSAFVLGVCFGMHILVRANWNLAVVMLLLATPLVLLVIAKEVRIERARRFGLFFLALAIVVGPWWGRNIWLTHSMSPFGTAGTQGLVGAYCDESLEDFGNWQGDIYREHKQELIRADRQWFERSLIENELIVGKSGTSKAVAWAKANWLQLPKLGVYRWISHWGMTNAGLPTYLLFLNGFLLLMGLAGCFLLTGPYQKAFIVVLFLDALIVMPTWSHYGRYGIPLRPLLHIGYGLAAIWFLDRLNLFPKRWQIEVRNPQNSK